MSAQVINKRLSNLRRSMKRVAGLFGNRLVDLNVNPFATHLPILVGLARLFEIRTVLEIGCGQYSTLTLLNRNAFPDLLSLHSFENDLDWSQKIAEMTGRDSRFKLEFVNQPMGMAVTNMPAEDYDLVFVDDSQTYQERAETIRKVADKFSAAKLVVIHDSEVPLYQSAASKFRNRFTFTALNPNTDLVWNNIPVNRTLLKDLNTTITRHSQSLNSDDLDGWITLFANGS